jgi:TPR repeat protein
MTRLATLFFLLSLIGGCDSQNFGSSENAQGKVLETEFSAAKREAGEGDALAQIRLGEMYALGQGVPQDSIQAASWLVQESSRAGP